MRVAIVGSGICGFYLSKLLSEKGEEIFLFEKKDKVGEKACSALYSERIFDFLPFAKDFIENKIEFCRILFPKKNINLKFKKNFFAFNRKKIEERLFEELLQKKNVKIFLKKEVAANEILEMEQNFDRIIGTDGANSILRKYLKGKSSQPYLGILTIVDQPDFSNFVEVVPTKKGFFWKIPRGKTTEFGVLEVGERAKKIFNDFLKEKEIKNYSQIKSALISINNFWLPENKKITLCGESAGMIKPWSGGGIIWGLFGAKILAESFPDFLSYKKNSEIFFKKQIFISKLLKQTVYFLGFHFPFFLLNLYSLDGDFFSIRDIVREFFSNKASLNECKFE
jgi:digeranylgeranylglycerophospholipid reductase